MLFVNHRDNGEKYDQQGSEGESLLKCMTQLVFFYDPVEGCQQDDNHETNQANRRQMEGKTDDQNNCDQRLNH